MTSIRYAIRSDVPESEWIREGRFVTNYHEYTLCSQTVAEADKDNGVSAVFTTTGEQASPWTQNDHEYLNEELAKLKPFPALTDMFKTPLEVGDYVLSAFDDRSNYLPLARVVGFTNKQVKVLVLGWSRIVSRNPDMLVRVHESVITPEPA